MVGLIKIILMLQQQAIPKNLHLQQLNPLIDLQSIPATLPHELNHWESEGLRCAGVSSFGFTGTNAHVLLQEYKEVSHNEYSRPKHLFTLSAQTPAALQQLRKGFAQLLSKSSDINLASLCHTLNQSRSSLPYRLALAVNNHEQLQSTLATEITPVHCVDKLESVVFVFAGQATPYTQMGYDLYQSHPLFKKDIDYCCSLFNEHLIYPLEDVLFEPGKQHLLQEPQYAQPAMFTLDYALARLWMSLGIIPDKVLGHNLGEYVAAVIAQVMNLEDGIRLLLARINWIQQFEKKLSSQSFMNLAEQIHFHKPQLPLITASTGNKREEMNATYWLHHLTAPVKLQQAIVHLLQEDFEVYLEIGPNPVLLNTLVAQHGQAEKILWLTSMQQGKNSWDNLFEILRKLYLKGFPINWQQLDAPFHIKHCPRQLPNYPFARNTYWFSQPSESPDADYFYEVAWEKCAEFQSMPNYLKGKHLIFINPDPVSISLAHDLVQTPENLVLVTAGSNLDTADQLRALDPFAPAQFQQLITELPDLREVIYLWGWRQQDLLEDELPEIIYARIRQASAGLLHLTQALSQLHNPPRVHVLTQGASSAFNKAKPWASVLWGMSKTLLTESPSYRYQHIDFDPDFSPSQLGQSFLKLNPQDHLKMAAIKGNGIYKSVLRSAQLLDTPNKRFDLAQPGTVLITGGMGGVGQQLCQELVDKKQQVILLGRRPLTAEISDALQILNQGKETPQVSYISVDVSNRCALYSALQSVQRQFPPLRGMIHAAGNLQDRMWNNLQWTDCEAVFQAKICGAMNLHQVAHDLGLKLDFFVFCSSISALMGTVGQGNYAAANAFIDAFAHWRQQKNLPALSINFGPWQQLGMTQHASENFSKLGIEPISKQQGRAVFARLLEQPSAQICFLPNHITEAQLSYLSPIQYDFLSPLIQLKTNSFATAVAEDELMRHLSQSSKSDALSQLREIFMQMLDSILHLPNSAPDMGQKTLLELGMDSMLANELLYELKHTFSWTKLNSQTLFFQNHSINALIDMLYNELGHELPVPTSNSTVPVDPAPHCFPLVPHQTEMMQYITRYPYSTAYNLPVFIQVEQKLNAEQVQLVIMELIEKNELLRAAIMTVYGQYFHAIHAKVSFQLTTAAISQEELMPRLQELYKKPINLEQPPLFNATLFYVGESKTVLAFVFHHVIADGVSIYLIMQDLFAALRENSHPPTRAPFHKYVRWLLDEVYPEINQTFKTFWQEKLNGFKVKHVFGQSLPKRKPARNQYPLQGSIVQFHLNKKQLIVLEHWVNRQQLTLASCLQAVIHKVLQEISGVPDSALVVFSNARNQEDWGDAIGQLAQHPALRCRHASQKTLPELAHTIIEELAQMERFQFMPPFQLTDYGIEIPKISFDYQSLDPDEFLLDGQPSIFLSVGLSVVDLWGDDPRHLAFKLIRQKNRGFNFALKYRMDIYNREQAEQILHHCQTIILTLIHDSIEELCHDK